MPVEQKIGDLDQGPQMEGECIYKAKPRHQVAHEEQPEAVALVEVLPGHLILYLGAELFMKQANLCTVPLQLLEPENHTISPFHLTSFAHRSPPPSYEASLQPCPCLPG